MNEYGPPNPAEIESEEALIEKVGDRLRDDEVGGRVVRGSIVRIVGYGVGSLATALASVFLLRYLGVSEFGKYATVMSLITIVAGITDAGLTTVGNRELALCKTQQERQRMIGTLFGIRLLVTPLGVLAAIAFTLVAGYESAMVWGTAVAGFGITLITASSAFSLALAVDLKIVRLTILDVIKQVVPTFVALVLIVIGASLLPFFAMAIPGALIALALTPWLAGRDGVAWPTFRFRRWKPLLLLALPVAIGTTIATIYIRILTVLMFELSSDFETGLFGTSVRVVEIFFAIPWIIFTIALPVLSVASEEDRTRTAYVYQRMIDVGLLGSVALAVTLCFAAGPVIEILGGSAYADAVPVLQIQAFAIVAAFIVQACMFTAVATGLLRQIVVANLLGLVAIVAIGVPMINAYDAEGAAITALIADSFTAVVYLALLWRADEALRISFGEVWKVVLAGALAVGAALMSGAPELAQATIALFVFAAVALVTRAVPSEVFDAFRGLRSR